MLDPLSFSAGTTVSSEWLNQIQNRNVDSYNLFEQLTLAEQLDVLSGGLNYDMSAKVQAAIDEAYAAGAGDVWCPAGKYRLDSTVKMKRHVALKGPDHRLPTASTYGGNVEATIIGIAQFITSASLTGSAFQWDFQLTDKLQRPYGATMFNILINLDATSGTVDGIHVIHPPAGEGVFSNGWAGGAVYIKNTVVMNAPRYGVYVQSSANEKVNAWLDTCRVAFSGSHGIYCQLCFDIKIEKTFSYANQGDGIYMDGCATERMDHNDVFNNVGHGITCDGSDARYNENAVENNQKHGYNIIASTSTITEKRYRIIGGRCSTNSYGADNTYSNIYIGDRAGAGISGIHIIGVSMGLQAHVGTANRVKHEIEQSVIPTQGANLMVGTSVSSQDLKSGNAIFNDAFYQSCNFESSYDPAGQLLETLWRPLTASGGGVWSPNVLRGTKRFKTQNTLATTLSGFSAGSARLQGREFYIWIDDANTGVDFTGTTLKGNGGVDLAAGAAAQGKILHFMNYDGTNWACRILG